ncbi:hypothetical protein [Ekhidna sp.]|uniref:hypothetical protein n=1 Tax=Ekhidna sp. TaxID=2608089 RepID=UPI003C7AADA6
MRILILCLFALATIKCTSNKQATSQSNDINANPTEKEFKPNPDEVIISAKLVAYESGIAKVEVIEQLAAGFGAKMVLNPGEIIDIQSNKQPQDNFICAFEVSDGLGGKKFRLTRILK